MKKHREKVPLVRISGRAGVSRYQSWGIHGLALLAAILLISLLLALMHYQPVAVWKDMISGAFGKKILIQETIKITIPLTITSMGVSLAFMMRVWNIGGEGQILMGGIAAAAVSFHLSGALPRFVLLLLMAVSAMAAAGLYGAFAAFAKARWGTNETLLTLMMNYIAIRLVILLQNSESWQDADNAFPKIRMIDFKSRLPKIAGVHIGWIIALILTVIFWIYVHNTRHGFEIKVIGDSQDTARYAGIPVTRVMVRTMFLSAALCGLAGFLQVSGADGTLSEATAGGMGFTAITAAWMANMNPFGILIVSVFLCALSRGASNIQTTFQIPASFSEVMTGIILLFMMGCEFFIHYKLVFRKKGE